MENDDKKIDKATNQRGYEPIEPVKAVNPMQATSSPHMPTKMEFSQKQEEKDSSSSQKDDSE